MLPASIRRGRSPICPQSPFDPTRAPPFGESHEGRDRTTCIPRLRQAQSMEMISESVVLRCIANCLETSQFYAAKGNRARAGWWHGRADMYADRLATYADKSGQVAGTSCKHFSGRVDDLTRPGPWAQFTHVAPTKTRPCLNSGLNGPEPRQ